MTLASPAITVSKSVILVSTLLALISCGGSKAMLDDIDVQPSIVDGDIFVAVSANLSIGNVTLPMSILPIVSPRTGEEIGTVSLFSNTIDININVSKAANVDLDSAVLPNGTILPIIGNNDVITIPLGSLGKLYLSPSAEQFALGVAIPIRTLDKLGRKIGTSSLFPTFHKKDIFGAAGLFTSKSKGRNGIGLFVDLSSVVSAAIQDRLAYQAEQAEQEDLIYSSIVPSSRKKRKIDRGMYRLHRKRTKLKLH